MQYISQLFAAEFRTPPLPLISLLGCEATHRDIGDFLVQQHRPPLVSISSVEPLEQFLTRAFGPRKANVTLGRPAGIFKADWFTKHRGRKPAVALAIVTRAELEGDPNTWNRMLYRLKTIRDATLQSGAGMVVAVVQDMDAPPELPIDRVTAVCHNLSLETRLLLAVPFANAATITAAIAGAHASQPQPAASTGPSDDEAQRLQSAAMVVLGQLVHEQCIAYYGRCSRRVADKLAERREATGGAVPGELLVRSSFKAAVFAEFQQDWSSAVHSYQEAYSQLRVLLLQPDAAADLQLLQQQRYGVPPVLPAQPGPCQRYLELCKVAELVHLKILMLLLHQGQLGGAATQAREHHSLFSTPPESLPPIALVAHLGFRIRQYQVAAELVGGKVDALLASSSSAASASSTSTPAGGVHATAGSSPLSLRDCSRPSLLTAAAMAAVERRKLFEAVRGARAAANGPPLPAMDVSAVKRGPFVGQLVLRRDGGTTELLSEADYLLYVELEEGRANHAQGGLEVLSTALIVLKDAKAERLRSQLGMLMAAEHVAAHNLSSARKLLLQVCQTYRRDGWTLPLIQALSLLRDVAIRLRIAQEAVVYSLELSVLPGAMPPATAAAVCRGSVATLLSGVSDIKGGGILVKQAAGAGAMSHDRSSARSDPSTPGMPTSSSSFSSTATPKHFHYTIEHLDLKSAQRKARETTVVPSPSSQPPPSSASSTSSPTATATASGSSSGAGSVAEILQRHSQQDFGWWRCIAVAGGFSSSAPDPDTLDFHLAFCNLLEAELPLRGVSLVFSDDQGEFSVFAQPGLLSSSSPPHNPASSSSAANGHALSNGVSHSAGNGLNHSAGRAEEAPASLEASASIQRGIGQLFLTDDPPSTSAFTLTPHIWATCGSRLTPRTLGTLRAESATLLLGQHTTITYKLSSFPSKSATLGSLHLQLPSLQPLQPFKSVPHLVPGAWSATVAHIGPLPALALPPPAAPLLLGEWTALRAKITTSRPLVGATLEAGVKYVGVDPADVEILLQHGSSLSRVSGGEPTRSPLPPLPSNGTLHATFWVRAQQPGRILLALVLLCPMPVTASVDVTVEEPFEHKCRLSSEAGVHTLTLPRINSREVGTVALTIGQPIMVTALIRALQQTGLLELVDVQVDMDTASGLMAVADVRQQLLSRPLRLSRGDVHTLLLPVCPTKLADTGISLGRLRLGWKRATAAAAAAAALDGVDHGITGSAEVQAQADSLTDVSLREDGKESGESEDIDDGNDGGQAPRLQLLDVDALVYTVLELPRVTVQESLLTARAIGPTQVTAGINFCYSLQVQNFSASELALSISLQDSPTFLCQGERHPRVKLAAKESQTVLWMMVATLPGHAQLPGIRVNTDSLNCSLLTQGPHVFVLSF